MTGKQLFLQLVDLRDEAGAVHYQRVAMAQQLLADKEWVTDRTGGGGDEDKALDRLEAECFGDLCGLISLPQLLEIYHHMPDIRQWQKHKFNLAKIWKEWRGRQPKRKVKTTADRLAEGFALTPPEDLETASAATLRRQYARAYKAAEFAFTRLDKANEKLYKAEQDVAELKAKLAQQSRKTA